MGRGAALLTRDPTHDLIQLIAVLDGPVAENGVRVLKVQLPLIPLPLVDFAFFWLFVADAALADRARVFAFEPGRDAL